MSDREAEHIVGMVRSAIDAVRSLRAERHVSKTAPAAIVIDAPTWTLEAGRFLQRACEALHCNAVVLWRAEGAGECSTR